MQTARAFVHTDPLSSEDERRLARHVEDALRPHATRAVEMGFDCVVGSSGTILALGSLALELGHRARPESLRHVTVGAESLHAVRRRLADSSVRARQELPGMERRADIIVAGGVVVSTLLRLLGARELVLCEWALREGLLLDYICSRPGTVTGTAPYPDVRRRSVMGLAARYQHDRSHARHVADLALSRFDQTQGRHRLGAPARALLEYAALLHDVGHHISFPVAAHGQGAGGLRPPRGCPRPRPSAGRAPPRPRGAGRRVPAGL